MVDSGLASIVSSGLTTPWTGMSPQLGGNPCALCLLISRGRSLCLCQDVWHKLVPEMKVALQMLGRLAGCGVSHQVSGSSPVFWSPEMAPVCWFIVQCGAKTREAKLLLLLLCSVPHFESFLCAWSWATLLCVARNVNSLLAGCALSNGQEEACFWNCFRRTSMRADFRVECPGLAKMHVPWGNSYTAKERVACWLEQELHCVMART